MEKRFIQGLLEKAEDNVFTFVASDESPDRHGDVLPIDNWDLKNYKRAPRLLADHDHRVEKIVGKAEKIRVEGTGKKRKLVFNAVFHELTELSRAVAQMVRDGFLNTVSVGFIPHGEDVDGKYDPFARMELVEISLVTVPANPNAQQIKSLMEAEEKEEVVQDIAEYVEPKFLAETEVKQRDVQVLYFSKKKMDSLDEAKEWAESHAFKTNDADENKTYYTLRQFGEKDCVEGSERAVVLDKENGVRALVCRIDKSISPANNEAVDETVDDEKDAVHIVKEKITTPAKTHKPLSKKHKGTKKGRTSQSPQLIELAMKEAVKILNRGLQVNNETKANAKKG